MAQSTSETEPNNNFSQAETSSNYMDANGDYTGSVYFDTFEMSGDGDY